MQTAMEWVLTGRVFRAPEALEGGLVRSLPAPEDLLPTASALGRAIADNTAPVSAALARQLLWTTPRASHPRTAQQAESIRRRCVRVNTGTASIEQGGRHQT